MSATVYHYDNYDIATYSGSYNIMLSKEQIPIINENRKVGKIEFIVGEKYTKIGTNKLTSSGYTFYDGEPLIFKGHYDDYILFEKESHPSVPKDYLQFYYCFKIMKAKEGCLFTVNHAGAGRIINL